MSFIGGMVICFFGGFFNSLIYRKYLRKRNKGWLAWFGMLFLGAIISVNLIIYFNIIDIRILNVIPWINISEGIDDPGKYWMFTPGLGFGTPLELPVTSYTGFIWHIYAFFFLISYIWWFTIGQNMGRFMFGRLTYEKGSYWLMRPTTSVKKSKEKFERKMQDRNNS